MTIWGCLFIAQLARRNFSAKGVETFTANRIKLRMESVQNANLFKEGFMKKTTYSITVTDWDSPEPYKLAVEGYVIEPDVFAVRADSGRWVLDHLVTGVRVSVFKRRKDAADCGAALLASEAGTFLRVGHRTPETSSVAGIIIREFTR